MNIVTKCARRAARRCGAPFGAEDKAIAHRRYRHKAKQELRAHGDEADLAPKRLTGWDIA